MRASDSEHGREGPRVTIERSCQGCRMWRTPDWCPVLAQARPNDGRSGRCGIRISGDAWCVPTLDMGENMPENTSSRTATPGL